MSVPSLIKEVTDPIINQTAYKWKTDLLASQKFWTGITIINLKSHNINICKNILFRMVYWINKMFFIN
jgi:hypothetical protein